MIEKRFSSKKFYHKRPYIENDYFCYVSTDLTDSNAKFYRIPLNNLSRSAVEEFNPRKNRLGDTRYRKIYLDEIINISLLLKMMEILAIMVFIQTD